MSNTEPRIKVSAAYASPWKWSLEVGFLLWSFIRLWRWNKQTQNRDSRRSVILSHYCNTSSREDVSSPTWIFQSFKMPFFPKWVNSSVSCYKQWKTCCPVLHFPRELWLIRLPLGRCPKWQIDLIASAFFEPVTFQFGHRKCTRHARLCKATGRLATEI